MELGAHGSAYVKRVPEFAVTAIGRDRPGIVAALSDALLDVAGNIEDSQMSILRGHFAVMLLVSVPGDVGPEELSHRLDRVREELELEAVSVSPIDDLVASAAQPSHVITVYGADHPGIVHAVSAALAERGVNIDGLETRLAGGPEIPLYVMIIEASVGGEEGELAEALREVGREAGVEVSIRELGAEAL
jgi:glycine cleavage system transcriptional repressor